MSKNNSFLAKPANSFYILCISAIALSILGLIMVFSASSIHSIETNGSSLAIVARQSLFLLISIPAAIFISRVPVFGLKKIARYGLLFSAVLLLALRIPGVGKSVNGNTNWISLGIVDVQPSEVVKFLMILWASLLLAKKIDQGKERTNVFFLIGPGFALIMLLVMAGKDLGTTSVIAAILAGLLFVSGVELKLLGWFTAGTALIFAFFIATAGYRAQRFLVVLNPFAEGDYKNAGWQPAHSLLGLASGGLFGVGLGGSRQKWGNLAEAHTDFIFSVIGEELGLVGTLAVLLLIGALLLSIFKISLRATDSFSRFVCAGIGSWIAIQTLLNIGSATSLLPVVGVTLPLVSYGGSALIATFLGIGFVLGTALRDPEVLKEVRIGIEKRRLHS
jgi:cell division protein FtsW